VRADTFDDDARDLDVLILGPVPPPFGGISVHLSRVAPLLEQAGLRVAVLNHFDSQEQPFVVGALNRNPFNYYRLPRRFRARVLHYHHSRWAHLVAFVLGNGRRDVARILTLHAGDIAKHFPQLTSRTPFVRRITLWALRRFDTIILVDRKVADVIRHEDTGARIEVLPAFVDSAGELPRYEPALEEFLSEGRVLVAAAYGVQFLDDGGELYGLDTLVAAFERLAKEMSDLRLALFVARAPERRRAQRHLEELRRGLAEAGLEERVFVGVGLPLLPAFRDNVVFVRPTRAEGDALSVREAKRAGVPVVASDVVERPAGVTTFPTGDAAMLVSALRTAFERGRASASRPGTDEQPADTSFADELIRIYRRELASRGRP
jgi:glycosyltransferase involved in cell wall biosynthesis